MEPEIEIGLSVCLAIQTDMCHRAHLRARKTRDCSVMDVELAPHQPSLAARRNQSLCNSSAIPGGAP